MDSALEHDDYLFNHLIALQSTRTVPRLLVSPRCVTVDPCTNIIYVGDVLDEYLCVLIYSESGELVNVFFRKGLRFPLSIAIHQDDLYIALSEKPFLVHFKPADDLHLIRSKEDIGSGVDYLKQLRKLTVSISGDVFITDFDRHRVQILDRDLNFKRQISHSSMIYPIDVKLTANEVFVLCLNPLHSRFCILVFDQMGYKLRSIILRGLSKCVLENCSLVFLYPYMALCLDGYGNFIINDVETDEVKFFTKEGTIFQELGKFGIDPGMFCYIGGLALTTDHKLVVVSSGTFKLRIFSCF